MDNVKKRAVIIGAGPAGLTAAYELLKKKYSVLIIEESNEIGGISRTINYKGNRIDIGGHRFFSKSKKVTDWWASFLPVQGSPSKDDIILDRKISLDFNGPNPEFDDRVMLLRQRVSRIYYLRNFFDYPIKISIKTIRNMGFFRTLKAGYSYFKSSIIKRKEYSLEDFFINRFGRSLYKMFFENYTEKVWGIHPSNISSDWGAQRVKGLSLYKAVIDFFVKVFSRNNSQKINNTETSLIEEFLYPKYGPGHLWETVSSEIETMGGKILMGSKVTKIKIINNQVKSIRYEKGGNNYTVEADYLLSSMPISDLIQGISGTNVPGKVMSVAKNLPYRDFITVGVLLKNLNLKNESSIKTINSIIPDCWIYIQEPDVKLGRLQIFNNWSPYLVKDFENSIWIGLEYFCAEGDSMWNMNDKDFISFAIDELERIGIINKPDVIDTVRIKVKKAYPAYFGAYKDFDLVKEFLNSFNNLYCIGRNGQHRYNNMDHSMMTAFEAVEIISTNKPDKNKIWEVNTENDYHESNKKILA